jgi:hypothetical protein
MSNKTHKKNRLVKMPNVLTTDSSLICPHPLGKVTFLGTIDHKLKVQGKSVLLLKDFSGAKVDGCPIPTDPNSTPPTHQCTTVTVTAGTGQSSKLFVQNQPVMLNTLAAITDGVSLLPLPSSYNKITVSQVQQKLMTT